MHPKAEERSLEEREDARAVFNVIGDTFQEGGRELFSADELAKKLCWDVARVVSALHLLEEVGLLSKQRGQEES